jgi:hypothetical protein
VRCSCRQSLEGRGSGSWVSGALHLYHRSRGPPIEENVEEPLHLTVGCGIAVVTYLRNQMNETYLLKKDGIVETSRVAKNGTEIK